MNRRIDPKAAFDASARHLRQALRNNTCKSTPAEMRTTFSVNREIHDALRLLAAHARKRGLNYALFPANAPR